MKSKNRQLIALSAKMVRIGKRMETEKQELKELVDRGYGYDSPEVKTALARYLQNRTEWEETERAYLALRNGDA